MASLNCDYCGEPPKKWNRYFNKKGFLNDDSSSLENANRAWILINGIDRVDNKIGYVVGNCVPCCTACNDMKKDKEKDNFLIHVQKIASFQDRKDG